jgi:hypothetical protein
MKTKVWKETDDCYVVPTRTEIDLDERAISSLLDMMIDTFLVDPGRFESPDVVGALEQLADCGVVIGDSYPDLHTGESK